jgi:hypothetical protein
MGIETGTYVMDLELTKVTLLEKGVVSQHYVKSLAWLSLNSKVCLCSQPAQTVACFPGK